MKSTAYRTRLRSRETTGQVYYGWQLRKILEANPEKFAWGRALPWAFSLAMFGGIFIAAISKGPMQLGAALAVLVLALAAPLAAWLFR